MYFWIAIEALTPHRTTSPKTVEAMLVSAGFDPDTFGEPNLGRLAGLRADIVHSGSTDDPLIENGLLPPRDGRSPADPRCRGHFIKLDPSAHRGCIRR